MVSLDKIRYGIFFFIFLWGHAVLQELLKEIDNSAAVDYLTQKFKSSRSSLFEDKKIMSVLISHKERWYVEWKI